MIKDKYYYSLNREIAKAEQEERNRKHLISELVWFVACVVMAVPFVIGLMTVFPD